MLNSKVVTIDNKSRDNGLRFEVTEMPLVDADRWATRFCLALMRSGMRMTNSDLMNVKSMGGILEIVKFGFTAFGYMEEDLAIELLDQLVDKCVKIIPSAGTPRKIVDGDIESKLTLPKLRWEAFAIHNDFLELGDFSNSNPLEQG
jgi:hypothetical protein